MAEARAGISERAVLACPVRACGQPLQATVPGLGCARGHGFDRARSGYVNLLQPGDRRSLHAGDALEVARARRALHARGLQRELHARLRALALEHAPLSGAVLLDLGCGEGSALAELCRERACTGYGLDLSVPAIELAARAHPHLRWIVANADRRLPLLEGSVDLVLALDARAPAEELARVLAPAGCLLLAVAGSEDLAELRSAALGDAHASERAQAALTRLAPRFELVARDELRTRARVPLEALDELLLATYRAGRAGRADRLRASLAGATELELGSAHDLLVLRPRSTSAAAR
jgi:23S rRNA (guanine745-N1)-methyltransferase